MKRKFWVAGILLAAVAGLWGCGGDSGSFDINKINPDDYVTLGQYKGIELKKDSVEVTQEELNESIRSIQESNAELKEVTGRPVQKGDTVTITYEGKMDGESFEGGTNTDGMDLKIGSNSFIPGFEDGIIGHEDGETFDLDLTFPENYKAEELQGKPVTFTVSVLGIKEPVLPEFNDEFVQSISKDYKTADEYRQYLKDGLMASKESTAQNNLSNSAWDIVVKNTTVKSMPEELIKEKFDKMYESAEQYAESYGVEVEKFITDFMQTTEEEFKKEAQQYAEEAARESLIVAAIAKAENLKLTEQEIQDAVTLYSGSYGYKSEDEFKENTDMEAFKEYILTSKVKDFVVENASVEDAE